MDHHRIKTEVCGVSIGEIGQELGKIVAELPLAILRSAAESLERASQTLAQCAEGSTSQELSEAVERLVAEQQRALETWQIVLRAREAIDRYRAHIGANDVQTASGGGQEEARHANRDMRRFPWKDDWGTHALAGLPRWRVGQTTGRYTTDDGMGDTIVSGAESSGLFVRELPRFGPAGVPEHGLKLAVDQTAGYGALAYLGEFEENSGTWVTASETAPADGPTLYLDFDNATEFPPNSLVPLDVWRRALHEFLASGGNRPVCVGWQHADVW